jgi:PBP1b-binding outer membrane lipoprotein LpoB
MKYVLMLLAALLLTGCEKKVVYSDQVETFEVVDVQPPKRFKVELRNVDTGRREWHYVSKRCHDWDRLEIGSKWKFRQVVWVGVESGTYSYSIYGTDVLCPNP